MEERNIKYRQSKKGVVYTIYNSQKLSSIRRGHKPPTYSLQDLREWAYSQKIFHELYEKWVLSDYDRWTKPSFDRIDDNLGYSLSNIQIMTWKENDMKDKHTRKSKEVHQFSKKGEYLNTFASTTIAAEETNTQRTAISRVAHGHRPFAGGYSWNYKH